jgi:hypothetical protein
MTAAVWFAFLAGFGFGAIATSFALANAIEKSTRRRIQNGYMEERGVVYRITRFDREIGGEA